MAGWDSLSPGSVLWLTLHTLLYGWCDLSYYRESYYLVLLGRKCAEWRKTLLNKKPFSRLAKTRSKQGFVGPHYTVSPKMCWYFQLFNFSSFQLFNISTFQLLIFSSFQHFNLSTFQDFKISTFQDFKISTFQDFNFQHFQLFNLEECSISMLHFKRKVEKLKCWKNSKVEKLKSWKVSRLKMLKSWSFHNQIQLDLDCCKFQHFNFSTFQFFQDFNISTFQLFQDFNLEDSKSFQRSSVPPAPGHYIWHCTLTTC